MQGLKSAILAIFKTGPGWLFTVSAALKIPHRISKIIFALSANKFLAMLEGKIRLTPFSKGSIFLYNLEILAAMKKAVDC